jgi:putative intracellular protease/amidase
LKRDDREAINAVGGGGYSRPKMRIAIAVFEGAEELDFAGPWEVLAAWRFLYPDDVEVVLVGESSEPVRCAKGMRVLPETSWDQLGDVDVLVYPGGRGTRAQLGDETIRMRLRALKERGTLMTSVCTGALVYADAGLLDGQPATTYWSAFDELLPLGRDIEAQPDQRFVDNGDVITAAGVSAGIDMSSRPSRHARQGARGAPLHPVRPATAVLVVRVAQIAGTAEQAATVPAPAHETSRAPHAARAAEGV